MGQSISTSRAHRSRALSKCTPPCFASTSLPKAGHGLCSRCHQAKSQRGLHCGGLGHAAHRTESRNVAAKQKQWKRWDRDPSAAASGLPMTLSDFSGAWAAHGRGEPEQYSKSFALSCETWPSLRRTTYRCARTTDLGLIESYVEVLISLPDIASTDHHSCIGVSALECERALS